MCSLRHFFTGILMLTCFMQAHAQLQPAPRNRFIQPLKSQQLDSLSIIAESFVIKGPDGQPLDQAFYRLDFVKASLLLTLPEYWQNDSLLVQYRVFPVNFTQAYFHQDTSLIGQAGPGEDFLFRAASRRGRQQGLIPAETLFSSGSITRGISMGNRQDVSLNSAMNLQLTGQLSEEIGIAAVISDQNIPFQPDGTTRQLQDFDKVFIQLTASGGQLLAGDFELQRPAGHFMNFTRRAQGSSVNYKTNMESAGGLLQGASLEVSAAGAIARGKYVSNQITALEGNQGPYRLSGANNESFIMILAGSEKVYIDGMLLQRGMDHDYVMDYNMAEISFTSRRIIRRESRIIIEFEYAERNYARSLLFSGVQLQNSKTSIRFNFFSEQDHPGQPLFQELSDERIQKMSRAGDNPSMAFDWNIDSIGFRNDRIMYRLTDSLGVDTVFVFSTDPHLGVYQVGFTFVGEGKGHYRPLPSSANGKVYQWVAALDGIPQGTHDPIIRLVTPKKDQMMTLGTDLKIASNAMAGVELAFSNKDLNLFSDVQQANNTGYALRLHASNQIPLGGSQDNWQLHLSGEHEMVSASFSALERYRPLEFSRDWNLLQQSAGLMEHLSHIQVRILHPQKGMLAYSLRSLFREDQYRGLKNSLHTSLLWGKARISYEGAMLNSHGLHNTAFYRHQASLSRPLLWVEAGVEHQLEHNRMNHLQDEQLEQSSFSFDQWMFYIGNPAQAKNNYRLFWKIRHDMLPQGMHFREAARSREVGASWQMAASPSRRLQLTALARKLDITQPLDEQPASENTFAGRMDMFFSHAEGMLSSSLFYETGSGMERMREYIFLEVPAGQGFYTWNDYNGNGIRELDEFELAAFPDQANFIRIFVPTDGFVRVFSNLMSFTLNLDPSRVWSQQKGWRRMLSRFYNQLVFRVDQKMQGNLSVESFNPFGYLLDEQELSGLNASVRNTLFFNRSHPRFGAEWIVVDQRNRMLLSNGFESRRQRGSTLRNRWNINNSYTLALEASATERENLSEFFNNRNFQFRQYQVQPMLSYQPLSRYRISFFSGFTKIQNQQKDETARLRNIGAEAVYNTPGHSSLSGRYQLSRIQYPFELNTPIAFEMLGGLMPGKNHLWNIGWQQNLNNWLQLNLNYHGRKPFGLKSVHTGNMQLRAFF